MASDLKSNLVSESYDMGPHVNLMGNPAVLYYYYKFDEMGTTTPVPPPSLETGSGRRGRRQRSGTREDSRNQRVRILLSRCSPYSPLLLTLLLSDRLVCCRVKQ